MTTLTAHDLSTVDLSDLSLWGDGPPHGLFTQLRAEAPLHWSPMRGYDSEPGFWSLTRAADIAAASRDFETFSSERGGIALQNDIGIPLELMQQQMIMMDPPRHDRLKALVQRGFTPRRVAGQRDRIEEVIDTVLADVAGRETFDLAADVGERVPSMVTADLLGVPRADAHKLADWTRRNVGFEDPESRTDFEDGMRALGEMAEYVGAMVADRRQNPKDDLVSALCAAEVDGEKLSDTELIMFFWLLMIGGSDTTLSAYAGGMRALIEHPEQRQLLLDDPSRMPNAVEEVLRYVSPFSYFRRTAQRDVELHGQTIAEGDKVVLWYASGNRDERVTEDGQRFDITRPDIDHQAFGGGGRHFCLGAGLARLELAIPDPEDAGALPDARAGRRAGPRALDAGQPAAPPAGPPGLIAADQVGQPPHLGTMRRCGSSSSASARSGATSPAGSAPSATRSRSSTRTRPASRRRRASSTPWSWPATARRRSSCASSERATRTSCAPSRRATRPTSSPRWPRISSARR